MSGGKTDRVELIIDAVLDRERGYVDHPADRGGPTNWGVTMQTLGEVMNRQVTANEVREITRDQAKRIYLDRYVLRPGLIKIINPHVMELAVDCAVSHGPARAVKMLQQAAGVTIDGTLGPLTERAVNAIYPPTLYRSLLAIRCRFYGGIITTDHTQAVFAAGWMDRLSKFIEVAP